MEGCRLKMAILKKQDIKKMNEKERNEKIKELQMELIKERVGRLQILQLPLTNLLEILIMNKQSNSIKSWEMQLSL